VARLDDDTPANIALQLHVNVSLSRPPDRTWRRPPGHPRIKWLDQLRNDSTRPIGDLWRRAVDRGHGGANYYFACAAVAVDSGPVTASSSASWSRFSPPSNFVNGHVSTMWFMVCRWPQSQGGDWALESRDPICAS